MGRKDGRSTATQLGLLAQLEIDYTDGTRQVDRHRAGMDRRRQGRSRPPTSTTARTTTPRTFDAGWSEAAFDTAAWAPVAVREFTRLNWSRQTARRFGSWRPCRAGRDHLARPAGRSSTSGRTSSAACASPSRATPAPSSRCGMPRSSSAASSDRRTAARREGHRRVHARGATATRPGRRGSRSTGSATPRSPAGRASSIASVRGRRGAAHRHASAPAGSPHRTRSCNRLHENVVWGMRGNFVDVPTDCPQRDERLGWTGDLQVFAPDRRVPLRLRRLPRLRGSRTSPPSSARYGGTPMVVPRASSPATPAPTAGVGGCRDRRAVDAVPGVRRPRRAGRPVRQHDRLGRRGDRGRR